MVEFFTCTFQQPGVVEPKQLYALMEQKSTAFLIVDLRPSEDYLASRINHTPSLNVPADVVKPGVTAQALESRLPVEARVQWRRRHGVDRIVALDWLSQGMEEGSPMAHLR